MFGHPSLSAVTGNYSVKWGCSGPVWQFGQDAVLYQDGATVHCVATWSHNAALYTSSQWFPFRYRITIASCWSLQRKFSYRMSFEQLQCECRSWSLLGVNDDMLPFGGVFAFQAFRQKLVLTVKAQRPSTQKVPHNHARYNSKATAKYISFVFHISVVIIWGSTDKFPMFVQSSSNCILLFPNRTFSGHVTHLTYDHDWKH